MDYDVGSSIHSEERGIGYDSPPAIIRTTRELESLSLNQLPTLPTSQELHGLVSLSTLSRWASDAGFLIGDGNVSQGLVALSHGKLAGFIWSNFDHRRGVSEVDLGLNYTVMERKLGVGTLSFKLGAQAWKYPTAAPTPHSSYDLLATATLSWSGPVTLTADFKHLFAGQSTPFHGDLLVLKCAREQRLWQSESLGSVTLDISTQLPIRHNFFIPDGLSLPCVRPGVALRWQDPEGNLAVKLEGRYQFGIDGRTPSTSVWGVSISYSF